MKRWLLISFRNNPEKDVLEWLSNKEAALEGLREMIKEANEECGDNDGHMPMWIHDTCIAEIRFDVVDSMDGLVVRTLPASKA